jgi:surface antigen
MKTMYAALALALAAAVSGTAGAQGGGIASIFRNTPAERFNEQDYNLLLAATHKALDDAPKDQPVEWANSATNHRGDVTATRIFESKGRACKELRLRNEADGRKGESIVNWCQVDGTWRLLSSSQLK